ncbi:hypothetical protein [Amycolatopsis sp. FDAARGOS 1241]|uniref:hypothetical protein n=1 Tax=Amycolatopsis sp. FDAARGOS 1241 TaxID=2778070 RepID=UPI00194EB601|nr:hypothetical protein [Amycolatopsis sp. FDAARGOS 1241]QRP44226.1 hypothetical protein I6J71_33785 [Amycolatopsis sp. FDAARGOS 1241]
MSFPATSQPHPPAKAGAGDGVKTFVTAVFLTFGVGLLGMVGWALLGSGFGGFIGLVAGGFGVYWWRSLHGKVFAPGLPTRSVVLLVVVNVVLAGILLLTAT